MIKSSTGPLTTDKMVIPMTESSIETLAGGFAGICQVLIGHPFDTIKVCKLNY